MDPVIRMTQPSAIEAMSWAIADKFGMKGGLETGIARTAASALYEAGYVLHSVLDENDIANDLDQLRSDVETMLAEIRGVVDAWALSLRVQRHPDFKVQMAAAEPPPAFRLEDLHFGPISALLDEE